MYVMKTAGLIVLVEKQTKLEEKIRRAYSVLDEGVEMYVHYEQYCWHRGSFLQLSFFFSFSHFHYSIQVAFQKPLTITSPKHGTFLLPPDGDEE